MTKKEVQQRVLQNGKPLDLDKFSWNEETKTFSSSEDYLVLDFKEINDCIIKVGSCCTVDNYIGFCCTITAGNYSFIKAGNSCNIETDAFSNIQARSNCKVTSGNNCIINVIANCDVNADLYCVINANSGCNINASFGCTFNADYDCNFETESDCTFKTGSNCTFKTGPDCVIVRKDIYEVIELEEGKKIKLNGIGEKGFTYLDEKKEMTVAEISKKLGYDIKIIK